MSFETIDGEDIFFSFSPSSASDLAFVLIHGAGGDHGHWPEELRGSSLADVHGLDLPGHGHSAGGKGQVRVEAYADIVQAFVSQRRLKRVVLFGHSMGGAIAQHLALRHPDWLEALVLVGTGARLRVAPVILEAALADTEAFLDLSLQYNFGPDANQDLISRIRTGFAKTDPRVLHGDFCACNEFDIMHSLDQINPPTLVVSATHDRLTPLKFGQYLHAHITGARLYIIENAGHMMALEKPGSFMAGVQAFIRERVM